MLISILNCDSKWGIGKRNGLLFNLPLDMKYFRETTSGHIVAMGENTLLSFSNSKPLKNRTHIVLSQDKTHNYEGVINIHDFKEFINKIIELSSKEDVYVIGGASIYNQTLPYVDMVYLNKVKEDGGAEVFFTNLDELDNFEIIENGEEVNDNGHITQLYKYRNNNKKGAIL